MKSENTQVCDSASNVIRSGGFPSTKPAPDPTAVIKIIPNKELLNLNITTNKTIAIKYVQKYFML